MAMCMENICRTCMNDDAEMISLFDSAIEDNSLADILINCTSVEVDKNDGLSCLICKTCLEKLTAAFNFKCQCEDIDTTLREFAMRSTIECVEDKNYCIEVTTKSDIESFNEVIICPNTQIKDEDNLEKTSYDCSRCNKLFKTHQEFINHEQSCGLESNICEKCGTTCRKNHKCTETYHCVHCDAKFLNKNEYIKHKREHKKIFKCNKCDREFRSSYGFKYHISVHANEKKFVCPVENCKKKFIMKQSLTKHMNIHSENKEHLCYLCGKAFNTHDTLSYHIKTHGGKRPHLCVHCGKTFKQMGHLNTHMWVHSGIKPHTCSSCGKCYTTRHKLKKHLKTNCKEH